MKLISSSLRRAFISLFLLAPSALFPQVKEGTVNVDSLAVYSRMSADSDVVEALAKGTVVRILLAVTSSDGNWCSIASLDSSARIGYVLCSGLEMPKSKPASPGGPLPQILNFSTSAPIQTSKPQNHRSIEVPGASGQTLASLPGYNWSSYPKTLVLAIRTGCPYCEASLPFYKQLGQQERNNTLHAHVLIVMPDDPSSGSRFLQKDDVDVQALFGQSLGALNVDGTPTVLLLDSSGRIERTWIGELTHAGEKDVLNAAGD